VESFKKKIHSNGMEPTLNCCEKSPETNHAKFGYKEEEEQRRMRRRRKKEEGRRRRKKNDGEVHEKL
jgi:hypothetical protein